MPWVLGPDEMETWVDGPTPEPTPAAPSAEEPGVLGKVWSKLTTPIHEQLGLPPLDFAKLAHTLIRPSSQTPEEWKATPYEKQPGVESLPQGARQFVGLTSGLAAGNEAPLNLALMGGGAALPKLAEMARAASAAGDVQKLDNILKLINVVRGGEAAGGAAVAAHGGYTVATGKSWPERGFGLAEMLMGGMGIRGAARGPELGMPEARPAEAPVEAPAAEGPAVHAAGKAQTRAAFKEALAAAGVSPAEMEKKTAAELAAMLKAKGIDPGQIVIKRLLTPEAALAQRAEVAPMEPARAESAPAPEVPPEPTPTAPVEAAPVEPPVAPVADAAEIARLQRVRAYLEGKPARTEAEDAQLAETKTRLEQAVPAADRRAQLIAQVQEATKPQGPPPEDFLAENPDAAAARDMGLTDEFDVDAFLAENPSAKLSATGKPPGTPTRPVETAGEAGTTSESEIVPPTQAAPSGPPSAPPPETPAGAGALPPPRPPMQDTRLPGGGNPQLSPETKAALQGLFKRQSVGRYNANVLNLQLHAKQAQIIRKYQDMIRGGVMNPVDAQHAQAQELKGLAAGIEDLPAGLRPEQFREAMQFIHQKSWTMDRFKVFRAANALQSAVEHGAQLQKNELQLMQQVFGRPVVAGNPGWFGSFLENLFRIHSSMRALVASADLSATLRQALVATVGHPGLAAKAFSAQLRALASESQYRLIQESLFNNPMRQLQQESGLFLAERGGYTSLYDVGISGQEEVYGGAYKFIEKLPWVGASERAYITYLNKMRSDLFNKKAYDMMREFMLHSTPPEEQAAAFKDLARAVNTMTGRGEISLLNISKGSALGRLTGDVTLGRQAGERALPFLNSVFFAPRFMASRLSMLRDLPLLYSNYSAPVRNEMLKSVAMTIGTGLSGLAAMSALTGAEVEWDPTSTDFAKVKVGDTRIDPWGGFQPWVRFLAQMTLNQRKSVKTGMAQPFGTGFGQSTRLDAAVNFMLQKTSPAASVAADVLRGVKFNGEQLAFLDDQFPWVGKDVWNRIAPMVWQDFYDAFQTGDVEQLALTVPADLLGMSAQTYNPWEPVSRPTQKVGP